MQTAESGGVEGLFLIRTAWVQCSLTASILSTIVPLSKMQKRFFQF